MTNELKCPNCGGTHIVQEDSYDFINGKNNTIKELCCGHCADCDADIQWEVVYRLIGYDNIEES